MHTFTLFGRLSALTLLCLLLSGGGTLRAQCPSLVWSDEFNGTTLDQSKWNYQTGDGCAEGICGWGNNELQAYQTGNVTVSNGSLKITARKERTRGSQYTSGRINSRGKGDFTYGRFEARIKLPYGDGLWPAFWMLSTDEAYGGWPQSGEIDIMEFVASNPGQTLGYIHYGDPYPNNQSQGTTYALGNADFPEAFHDFAVEWEPGEIRWFVDGVLFSRKTAADVTPYQWPFDQNFHFLLNVAVGGNLGGPVNASMLPATMEVDYVRVYDGFRAYLSGERVVANEARGITYSMAQLPAGTAVNWTVPAGATIVSGQGSGEIVVDFGATGGTVSASYSDGCQIRETAMYVEVEAAYAYAFSLETFDVPGTATYASSTGTLTEVSNPAPDAVNGSSRSGRYARNGGEQYDVLVYSVPNLGDADAYADKTNKFYLDVYTAAPAGTDIILQLETPTATASNFPTGRHSRYVATVTEQNTWQRLAFAPLDRPDASAPGTDVSKAILLFASNSFTADTYFYDNFDSYGSGGGEPTGEAGSVHVAGVTTGIAGAGKGAKAGTATVQVVDDLGNPVAGATVTGTFSGTFNETGTGTTDGAGSVTLTTSGSSKGTISLDFCVDDVSAGLPYDAAANTATCAGGGGSAALRTTYTQLRAGLNLFPNPVRSTVTLFLDHGGRFALLQVFDAGGRLLRSHRNGGERVRLDLSDLPRGVYQVRAVDAEGTRYLDRLVR